MLRIDRLGVSLALSSAALALSLAGCGGGGLTPSLVAPLSAVGPHMEAVACGKSVVYVTSYNNSVYIYNQVRNKKTACGQITGLTNPQGLFVDKHGNLWVAISGDCKNRILERARVCTRQFHADQDAARSRRPGYRCRRG